MKIGSFSQRSWFWWNKWCYENPSCWFWWLQWWRWSKTWRNDIRQNHEKWGRKVVENLPPRIGRSSNSKNLRKKSGCFCWFCRLAPGEAVSSGTMTWASSRATNVHEVNARNTKPMKARSDGKKNKWNLLCKHCWLPSWWRFIIFMIGHPSACFTPMQTILRSFEA